MTVGMSILIINITFVTVASVCPKLCWVIYMPFYTSHQLILFLMG